MSNLPVVDLFGLETDLTWCSDDLTVQVIFFGNGNSTGEVIPNTEASASLLEPVKAKL